MIAASTLIKIGWSLYYGGESGWAVVPPAMVGLIVIAVVIIVGLSLMKRHSSR
jgi:uncharacterized membrane protein